MNANELADLYRVTIREGGATWAPGRGQLHPTSGYGAGAMPGTFRKVATDDEWSFRLAVRALLRRHPSALIGTWADGPVIHVDPAVVLRGTLEEALTEAGRRGQVAVYDFATGTTHEVNR